MGVVLFNYVLMPLLVHQRGTVTVPDVVGLSEVQALRVLSSHSLDGSVVRREYHEEVPKGFVISQSPRRDENVKEGRGVSLIVSLGARVQKVPDLAGLTLRQARIVLGRNHLAVGRIARWLVEGETREIVRATYPGAGKEVQEGSRIDLLVASGGKKRSYMMPDLVGRDLLFARDKLEKMGFRIGNVRYERRSGVYPNTIIDQEPKPGSQIREGDSIELVAATTS